MKDRTTYRRFYFEIRNSRSEIVYLTSYTSYPGFFSNSAIRILSRCTPRAFLSGHLMPDFLPPKIRPFNTPLPFQQMFLKLLKISLDRKMYLP